MNRDQLNRHMQNIRTYSRQDVAHKARLSYNDKTLVPMNDRKQIGCGLVNFKNNCFFNAVIQALYHLPAFKICIEENEERHHNCVTCCIRDTFKELQSSDKTFFPSELYKLLQKEIRELFDGRQQDAHDFLLELFHTMNRPQHSPSSATKIFRGKTASTVTCSECSVASTKTKIFTSLQINILGNASMDHALKKYFSVEKNVEYFCETCNHNVEATKQFTIAKAPRYLCFQLMRFLMSRKITVPIQIPKTIDVNKYFHSHEQRNEKSEYKLVALVNHKGTLLNQGHYTTVVVKNAGLWYEFDDSHILRITNAEGNFESDDAYILFYEAVNFSTKGANDESDDEDATESPDDKYETVDLIEKDCTDDGSEYEYIPIEIIGDTDTDSTQKSFMGTVEDSADEEVNADSGKNSAVDSSHKDLTDDSQHDYIPIDIDDTDNDLSNDSFGNTDSQSEVQTEYDEVEHSSQIANETELLSGRRIVDIKYIFNRIQNMTTNTCKICKKGNMVCEKEIKRGLLSIFTFRCSYCKKAVRVNSCAPKTLCQSNVNESAALGIVSIGLGFYHLQEFLAHMDVHCMSYSTFHNLDLKHQADWWKLAKQFEAEALNEEIRLARNNNQVDSAGNVLVEVEIDGSWGKRSHGNNFSSLSGCAAIIGRRTNRIIYTGVKNKYCHVCKIAESKKMMPRIHDCKANYVGPSSGMETEIIVDGFKFCNEKGVRFHILVGDGDSSTYKAIRDLNLYKDPDMDTEKFECENHLYKNFNKKCDTLHTNRKLALCGRKLLPQNIGKMISKGVRMAAKHWRESDIDSAEQYENLEKDIMNAPLHYFGIHDHCASYFCDKTTDPDACGVVNVLKESGVYYELLDICQSYLSNNAKSLIAGLSTNKTEGFNSLICKQLGGKRVCNSLDGNSYRARTSIADVHYNTDGHSGSTFHEITYGGIKDNCLRLENTRKRKVLKNSISKEIKAKMQKLEGPKAKAKVKPKHYGAGHQDVDLQESAYKAACQRFFVTLKENQDNRHALVEQTKSQRHSFKWMQIRRKLLTSSYFSRILKANNRKSYTNIVEDILHKNVQYSNTAELRHQRLYQLEALSVFSQIYGPESVSQCGIFIDPEFCFLGATPFRLYGNDGIVIAKCPKKGFKMSLEAAFNKKLIPIWQGPLHDRRVNRKSHWYYEIQGQLHVTRTLMAYLIIYLGESIYEIVEIERNDQFWKESMEDELVFFYKESLLKELVDSRYERGMNFRKYDAGKNTFL